MGDSNKTRAFDSDPRTPCKYGKSCYQKNKIHHEKYKHPPSTPKKDTGSPEKVIKKHKPNSYEPADADALNVKEKARSSTSPKDLPNGQDIEEDNDSSMHDRLDKNTVQLSNHVKVKLASDHKDLVKQLFLHEMPKDFYSFWEMCTSLSDSDPLNALKAIKLKLVGPFDVLAGRITEVYEDNIQDFLKHWRFYYDPPEFQTVLASSDSRCYHIGYYRDDPREMPVFVASNVLSPKNPEKNGELKIMGPNLFAALNTYLEELKTDPFSRMKVPKFQQALTAWAKERSFSLEKSSKEMESRKRKVVAKTFHGAGIVVPVDKKNDVGYRELAAPNSMIKRILKGISESKTEEERTKYWEQLQPVITFANIANDECDFGTGLELGLDLFTFGSPLLHRTAKQLLTTAYNLLGRVEFCKIVEAHLEDRRQGGNLSVLEKAQ